MFAIRSQGVTSLYFSLYLHAILLQIVETNQLHIDASISKKPLQLSQGS